MGVILSSNYIISSPLPSSPSIPPPSPSSISSPSNNNKQYEIQQDIEQKKLNDISSLRKLIRDDSILHLSSKHIFILYCPPSFPLFFISKYISEKLSLPIYNIQTDKKNKLDYNLVCNNILNNIEFQNGCILCDEPKDYFELKKFKNLLKDNQIHLYLLFFQMDGQTLSNALDKFDRWVHEPSNRSYHLSYNPPKSFVNNQTLVDDETGEPLTKSKSDTIDFYRTELNETNMLHVSLYLNFSDISYHVDGGSDLSETKRNIMKVLFEILSKDISQIDLRLNETIAT